MTGLPSKFFTQLGGRSVSSSLMGLDGFQLKITHMPNERGKCPEKRLKEVSKALMPKREKTGEKEKRRQR